MSTKYSTLINIKERNLCCEWYELFKMWLSWQMPNFDRCLDTQRQKETKKPIQMHILHYGYFLHETSHQVAYLTPISDE